MRIVEGNIMFRAIISKIKKVSLYLGFLIIFVACGTDEQSTSSLVPEESQNLAVKYPEYNDKILLNPNIGWTSFHTFNDPQTNNGYPDSSVAYF